VTGDDCEGELMNERDVLADRFSAERTRLRAVAYRMLGSLAEAEDAVQEAWLRLARSDEAAIDNLGGWLTTVVGRVCLDMLRARTARREDADGHLPDPVVTYGDDSDPEAEAVLADSVGLALLVVLETLNSAERLAFVLHDMFAVPIPVRIVRAAQFHEFVAQLLEGGTQGDVAYVPEMRTQIVAARTVAEVIADIATSASDGDPAEIVEVAGPREEDLAQLATLLVARRGTPVKVIATRNPAAPDAGWQATGGLLPGLGAHRAGPTFETWLDQQ
jgi:RNA polymerase sigma factor (sigma-70 family)